jgi:adenosylcobinamide kinase/adenosylcobinamide-phosphate guanylyltransferase
MGVVPATAAGRRFRDALGRLNMALADESERVLLVVAGQVLAIRDGHGAEVFRTRPAAGDPDW